MEKFLYTKPCRCDIILVLSGIAASWPWEREPPPDVHTYFTDGRCSAVEIGTEAPAVLPSPVWSRRRLPLRALRGAPAFAGAAFRPVRARRERISRSDLARPILLPAKRGRAGDGRLWFCAPFLPRRAGTCLTGNPSAYIFFQRRRLQYYGRKIEDHSLRRIE